MIPDEQVARIRHLFHAEHWKIGTIASELLLHPDTVRRALETERFRNQPRLRDRLTDPYLDFLRQTLQQHPRLCATRLFQMIQPRGYTGRVTQLRRVVAELRPPRREAFLRLRPFPGEQAQADWAHFGEVRIGRARRRLSGFVLTLAYSRALWLEFFFDQSLENFLLGHVHAFHNWGGAPRSLETDNLRSVVLERRGDAIHFHPRYLELSAHYHFTTLPCRPARGNEKGRVERAIQYVRTSFFAARPFTTLEDFNRQALAWRDQIAHQRPWPGDDSRTVAHALEEEKPRLLPLPAHPFACDLTRTVYADKTLYVRFDLNDYSVPPQALGRALTLVASPTLVRLLDGSTEVASHRRSYDRHEQVEDSTAKPCSRKNAKRWARRPPAAWPLWFPKARPSFRPPLSAANPPPGSPCNCFACSMTMAPRNSLPLWARLWSTTPRACIRWPLSWPAAIASGGNARPSLSISRGVPIWKT